MVQIGGCYLRGVPFGVLLTIFPGLFYLIFSCSPKACAQVPGVFYPSAFGEVQEGFAPFPQAAPRDTPFIQSQRAQLEYELGFLRRPYLNVISAYANQSLLPINSQMDSFTPSGLEFGFYPMRQAQVQLFYLPTIIGTAGLNRPRAFGTEYRGVFRYQPTDRLKLSAQLGLFEFAHTPRINAGLEVLGAAGFSYLINDHVNVMGGFRRDLLGNSMLSTTGLNTPGTSQLVGRVTQELFYGVTNFRLTRKTALSLYYGGGLDTGYKVKTNTFQQASLYLGRPLYAGDVKKPVSLVLPSFQFLAQHWQYDLGGVGIDSVKLPADPRERALAISAAQMGATSLAGAGQKQGVGGYFSPQLFLTTQIGLQVAGHLYGPVYYSGGGGMGTGNAKSLTAHLNQTSLLSNAFASIFYRVGEHIKQEHGWYFLQASNNYRRQVIYSETKYYF